MTRNASWAAVFREVGRRRINGGYKTIGAEEITWLAEIDGHWVTCVSRVRLREPMESFLTPSNMRIRDSFVGRSGHWVDCKVLTPVSDSTLEWIQGLAQAADDRVVVVSRGRHRPARHNSP